MIRPLGSSDDGIPMMASRAAGMVCNYGTAAILMYTTGKPMRAIGITPSEPDFDAVLNRDAKHLVGVYALTSGRNTLARRIADDMKVHATERALRRFA